MAPVQRIRTDLRARLLPRLLRLFVPHYRRRGINSWTWYTVQEQAISPSLWTTQLLPQTV
uniref:Uncharacterized protein n=1 Tax=Oryza meridionalis TaxID=40149 RepID=A0A0E0CMN4_9ORYZ